MGGTFLRFTAFLHFFCFSSLTKTRNGCILCKQHVVAVAQLVRASGCGPEGRRFESDQPPHLWDHGGARKRISDFFCSESGTFRKIIVDPLCVPQSSRCCASDCPAHLLRFLVVAVASAPARLRRVALAWKSPTCPAVVLTKADQPPHFFCQNFGKKNNEAARIHFTAQSATSLKRRSLFFTSSLKLRSALLACPAIARRATADEVAPFSRL